MNIIVKNTKWLMLVSGILTATMFYGLFAPQAALESMFGTSFSGILQSIVIRSWSALIGLMGIILVYGAFNENVRRYSVAIAAFSKLVLVILVLFYGQPFLVKLLPAITLDIIVIIVAAIYLLHPVADAKSP